MKSEIETKQLILAKQVALASACILLIGFKTCLRLFWSVSVTVKCSAQYVSWSQLFDNETLSKCCEFVLKIDIKRYIVQSLALISDISISASKVPYQEYFDSTHRGFNLKSLRGCAALIGWVNPQWVELHKVFLLTVTQKLNGVWGCSLKMTTIKFALP